MSIVTDLRELLDEVGGGVFWTANHLYDALNEAQLELYTRIRHRQVKTTINLEVDRDIVELPVSTIMIPQSIIGIHGKYFPSTQVKLEQWARNWRATTPGPPKFFVLWDWEHLRVFPLPDFDYVYDVWGVPWPGEISATNEDINEHSLFKQAVVLRAGWSLLESTQPVMADQYLKESEELEYKFRRQLRNRHSKLTRIQPGTQFTQAQSGVVDLGRKYI